MHKASINKIPVFPNSIYLLFLELFGVKLFFKKEIEKIIQYGRRITCTLQHI